MVAILTNTVSLWKACESSLRETVAQYSIGALKGKL